VSADDPPTDPDWDDGVEWDDDPATSDPDHGDDTRAGLLDRGRVVMADDEEINDVTEWANPPEIRTGRLGAISEWYSLKKQRRKRRKAANAGVVEWYLVDGAWPEPRYVDPEPDGAGVPEYEHDGKTYLFPKNARVPSERSGMWVVVHERGSAEPLNLRDPARDSMDADVLDEWLTMSVSSSSPGLFDGLDFDLDPQTILAGGILLIILWAVASNVLGGGMPI
jgi:hypothetical protein